VFVGYWGYVCVSGRGCFCAGAEFMWLAVFVWLAGAVCMCVAGGELCLRCLLLAGAVCVQQAEAVCV